MIRMQAGRRARWIGGLTLLAALAVPILSSGNRDALEAGFADPPPEARLR